MWLLGLQGHVLSTRRACTHTSKCFTRLVRERIRKRERDSLLETMGHVTAKIMWFLERTGQRSVPVQIPNSWWPARESGFLCSPGANPFCVWDGPGPFFFFLIDARERVREGEKRKGETHHCVRATPIRCLLHVP